MSSEVLHSLHDDKSPECNHTVQCDLHYTFSKDTFLK